MKKTIIAAIVGLLLGTAVSMEAQGSLSSQVLRLLSRENEWTALQTFDQAVGVKLERASAALGTRTDKFENIDGNLYFNGALIQPASGSGTVTSVALTAPSILSVAGSPITTSGTLALTLATQTANKVFAGPTSGGAATPAFRSLVAADIPDISATYLTASSTATLTNKSGNISQWTNNSGYITNSVATLSSLTSIGTVGTGVWQGTVVGATYGGTGINNGSNTITLGGAVSTAGAFTTSGANALTLTTTGATNVTLPTSGTLLTSTATTLSSLSTVGTITSGTWNGTAIGVAYGGTNIASYAVGDIIYASGATTLSKLADVATGNVLISGGVTTAPAYGKVGLTTHVSGILPRANGGTGIDASGATNGQLLIGKTSDNSLNLATLTGTSNQVTVTNGAATITLSLPQSIATSSTPQFARLGLGTGAGASAVLTTVGQLDLGFINDGNCGASDTINWNDGEIHKSTLSAATCTYTFSNPISGREYVIHVIQDATGSRLVTWPGTVTWKGGSPPTLTTGANKTDICTFRWNGTAYLSECSLNF
jgi:hypothetical protein